MLRRSVINGLHEHNNPKRREVEPSVIALSNQKAVSNHSFLTSFIPRHAFFLFSPFNFKLLLKPLLVLSPSSNFMASLRPSWFSSLNIISPAKPSRLSSQFKPNKLSCALNPENAEFSETTSESQPGQADPIKLAFSKAKSYRESLKSNSDLKAVQNIAPSSIEKLNGNDGPSSGQNGVDDGGQKEVPMSLKIAMEKAKKYKENKGIVVDETGQGLQGGKEGFSRSNIVDNSVGKKEQLSVSKMDFIGLEFADKKQTRGLPPGLVPISDTLSSSDMPEVELIVGDTSKFDAATTAPKHEQTEEDESDLYKPKVSTWGVFPRPSNISKTVYDI